MGRKVKRLSARKVASNLAPGNYPDGDNLYLQVSDTRTKSWLFRYALKGQERWMGLGSARVFSLAEARERAAAARKLLADGLDPIESRDALRAQERLQRANSLSFAQCAEQYINAHRAGWGNEKHADQWATTLVTYANHVIGALPVQDVTTELVRQVLQPIWTTKHETAIRLRGRIEKVLDWAKVRGYRSGENPARWRGHMAALLPGARRSPKHLKALPYEGIGQFVQDLRAQPGAAARALELTILCALRTGAVIGAKPTEFDLHKALWTVPAERMKGRTSHKKEHRIPLSPRAVEIVRERLQAIGDGAYLFPHPGNAAQPLGDDAMRGLLKRLQPGRGTVHGFRSTFRDWSAECTNYANEICEMALAHSIGDKTEEAYRRGDLFEKRKKLMLDWARYCDAPKRGGKVLPMARRKATA